MNDNVLAGVLYNFRIDFITKGLSGVSTMPADFREIKKWLETPWVGKPCARLRMEAMKDE